MSRTLALGCLVAAALAVMGVLALQAPAYASHLPTYGDYVLMDLNPPGQNDILPAWSAMPAFPQPVTGGPAPTFAGSFGGGEFVDFQNNTLGDPATDPLHWQTEFTNPNSWWITFPAIFDMPNFDAAGSSPQFAVIQGVLLGWVGLLPGWSVTVDIAMPNIRTRSTTFPGMWSWAVGAYLPYPVAVDASVTADKLFPPPPYPPLYAYSFHGPNGETAVPPALANKVFFRPYGVMAKDQAARWLPSYWLETFAQPAPFRAYPFQVYRIFP